MILCSDLEIYFNKPTDYLFANRQLLIPDWEWEWEQQTPTLALILLQAQFPLLEISETIQAEKDRLLGKFIRLAQSIKLESDRHNILAEIIFPVDGKPLFSSTGDRVFNLPALIQDILNFPLEKTAQGCQVFIHLQWSYAVYPGLVLMNTSINKTEIVVKKILLSH
jgi:hypothetical protein